ncbi:hypothetical protein PHMEG_00026155 [Phytophthora megakarya]|uniref:Myb/SANT-like domain-containing protein n=1 Tax=Phytophthora megakarya TaxID=4795 RepID=A0A225VA97_9STRA|nr:hypothetical protein PHMEG_00026155 [Phytophthora megakarya]
MVFSAPIEEGLAFETGPESVYAVQDYALGINKSVRVERASGADRRLVCTSEAPCSFYVQIYRQRMSDKKTYGKWYIASMQLTHSEACDSARRLTTRQIAELPAFMAAVHANPKASVESLVALVQEQYQFSLEKQIRLVYRARDFVRSGRALVRNILPSKESPLPPRQFITRHARDKKMFAEVKKDKNSDRMSWNDELVEMLLAERLHKHGKEFLEAGTQQQMRELWGLIHQEFTAKTEVNVTVTQLRAKFRYLQEQYMKVRAEEEEFSRDPIKVVIYPRCWEMLVEYFADETPHTDTSVEVEQQTESNGIQMPVQSAPPPLTHPTQNTFMLMAPLQPGSAMYATPGQAGPPTESTTDPDVNPKRRRLNSTEAPASQAEGTSAVAEKLETIQSTQSEMARSMDGMKQVVEQSNEVIRGLHDALNQSNQVNAALLDFLRRQPSA